MKEVVRVFLERAYDDIWKRFAPLMDESMKQCVVPGLYIPKSFRTRHMCAVDMSEALFNQVKEAVQSAHREAPSPCGRVDRERPLVDDAHHTIRMCVANTVIWCNLVAMQAMDKEHSEQVRTVFSCLARAEVRSYDREKYFEKLRHDTGAAIPILQYRSTHRFAAVHGLVVDLMREVQGHLRRWLTGERTAATMKPVHAVLLQYAVEANKLHWNQSEKNIKMDHVYDVVHASTGRGGAEASDLAAHYSYVSYVDAMYDDVVEHVDPHRADPPPADTPPDAGAQWQWKVYRGIALGSKKTGHETQYFTFQHVLQHLIVTRTAAVPLLLCPSLDGNAIRTNSQWESVKWTSSHSARALLDAVVEKGHRCSKTEAEILGKWASLVDDARDTHGLTPLFNLVNSYVNRIDEFPSISSLVAALQRDSFAGISLDAM